MSLLCEYLPLEQGLRLEDSNVAIWFDDNLCEYLPLEQGLRQIIALCSSGVLALCEYLPLEQGLRPLDKVVFWVCFCAL